MVEHVQNTRQHKPSVRPDELGDDVNRVVNEICVTDHCAPVALHHAQNDEHSEHTQPVASVADAGGPVASWPWMAFHVSRSVT